MTEQLSAKELAAEFGMAEETFERVGGVPEPIGKAMGYIHSSTGLLGDYNDGIAQLAEGEDVIQWYGRSGRYLGGHNGLLLWVQKQDDLVFCSVGYRYSEARDEDVPYVEIHLAECWGIE